MITFIIAFIMLMFCIGVVAMLIHVGLIITKAIANAQSKDSHQ